MEFIFKSWYYLPIQSGRSYGTVHVVLLYVVLVLVVGCVIVGVICCIRRR